MGIVRVSHAVGCKMQFLGAVPIWSSFALVLTQTRTRPFLNPSLFFRLWYPARRQKSLFPSESAPHPSESHRTLLQRAVSPPPSGKRVGRLLGTVRSPVLRNRQAVQGPAKAPPAWKRGRMLRARILAVS